MEQEGNPTGKTILCVDDDAGMRSALSRLLKPLGHRMLLAGSGEEAIRMVREHRPDLILLDVMMPGMSGYEVLRRLREANTPETPVIMLTVKGSGDAVMKGYQEGCVYYIIKPFQNESVTNAVQYLIGDLPEEERQLLEQKL